MSNNPNENLANIAKLLEKIENHLAPPPKWQRVVIFFFQHFLLIVSIVFIAYIAFKIWALVNGISDTLDSIGKIVPAIIKKLGGVKWW